MPLALTWPQISLRFLCAVVAAGIIGLNRTEHGRAAGLRTSILVCLAACIAMVQVNLLLPMAGRQSDSFVMNDLMRLPLGILSGMGFIGAGAIVRRDSLVLGVTTAATMWFLTVVGLCFGAGEIRLGIAGTALGVFALAGLKFVEDWSPQDRHGSLVVIVGPAGPAEPEIRHLLLQGGFRISSCGVSAKPASGARKLSWELRWRARREDSSKVPAPVQLLAARSGVVRVSWTPEAG